MFAKNLGIVLAGLVEFDELRGDRLVDTIVATPRPRLRSAIPYAGMRQAAVPKGSGQCPSGWMQSGCLQMWAGAEGSTVWSDQHIAAACPLSASTDWTWSNMVDAHEVGGAPRGTG